MQLLGPFQSNISQYYYEQLLSLLSSSISVGDYAGGAAFSQDALTDLISQAQNFYLNISQTANMTAQDEDFNNPLAILLAQFMAIQSELTYFTDTVSQLISILNKDTVLLDYLIAGAQQQSWISEQLPVIGSVNYAWSYLVGLGPLSLNIPNSDQSGIIWPYSPQLVNMSNGSGMYCQANTLAYQPKALTWEYNQSGLYEQEFDSNNSWASIGFLTPSPIISYPAPSLIVQSPPNTDVSCFNLSGQANGPLSVYVRTSFTTRYNTAMLNLAPANITSNQFKAKAGEAIYISASLETTESNIECTVYAQYQDAAGHLILDNAGNPLTTVIGNVIESGSFTYLLTVPNMPGVAFILFTGSTTNTLTSTTTSGFTGYTITSAVARTPVYIPSNYYVDASSVSINIGTTYYQNGVDYVVSTNGNGAVTFINLPLAGLVSVAYNEEFPSYQCSLNQSNWSPTVMLDPNRPYPDNTNEFFPIRLGKAINGIPMDLPIIDEEGNSTGIFISLTKQLYTPATGSIITPTVMPAAYLLLISQSNNPASPQSINYPLWSGQNVGASATLEINFGKTSYMNAIHIEPTSGAPMIITNIDIQAYSGASRQNILSGQYYLDRPISINLPSTLLVGTAFITLYQQTYSIEQYAVQPDSFNAIKAINDLQGVIPSSAQEIVPNGTIYQVGYQYDIGLENIRGELWSFNSPTIFTAGPYTLKGFPDVLLLNTVDSGGVAYHLCYTLYDQYGNVLETDTTGINSLIPSSCFIFVPVSATPSLVASATLYIKVELPTSADYVTQFLLQVVPSNV